MIYTCDKCGYRVNGENHGDVVYSRGYWWHRSCASWWAPGVVAFPSGGKMMPKTILTEIEDERVLGEVALG